MLTNTREYNFWFVFRRAEDVPGEWTGHCLGLDVVSQGASLQGAMAMLTEACFIVLGDDIAVGKDPLDRRAPESFWSELYKICREGETREFSTLEESKVHSIACQVQIKCLRVQDAMHTPIIGRQAPMTPQPLMIPLTWAEPATTQARCC
jgi:hypothetical protein